MYKCKGQLKADLSCDLEGIQTPNLLIRSQMLYSVELRGPYIQRAKIKDFFKAMYLHFEGIAQTFCGQPEKLFH